MAKGKFTAIAAEIERLEEMKEGIYLETSSSYTYELYYTFSATHRETGAQEKTGKKHGTFTNTAFVQQVTRAISKVIDDNLAELKKEMHEELYPIRNEIN